MKIFSCEKGGIDMRIQKKPPDGWFGENLHRIDPVTGRIRPSCILTPKDDGCKMRLGPFAEGTKMVPPASRGVSRWEK